MKLSIKIVLGVTVSAVIMSGSANASEKTSFYLSGKMGTSFIEAAKQEMEDVNNDNGNMGQYRGKSGSKTVFNGSIAIGYDFYEQYNQPIRTELELTMRSRMSSGYRLNSVNKIKNNISLNTLMLNAYYDFKNQSAFTPYISLGAGLAGIKQRMNAEYLNESSGRTQSAYSNMSGFSGNFAWGIGVGAQFAITDKVNLDMSYRYLNAGYSVIKNDYDNMSFSSKQKISTNDVMLGIAYKF